jgi:low affinity Fe/Cu permease
MHDIFDKFAHRASRLVGSPWAFLVAVSVLLVWVIAGPVLGFSETWQLIINTTTTIITFLMVFLIQNTQNRDAQAMNLKLDELVRAVKGARKKVIDLEEMPEDELKKLQKEFRKLALKKPKIK